MDKNTAPEKKLIQIVFRGPEEIKLYKTVMKYCIDADTNFSDFTKELLNAEMKKRK